MKSDTLWQSIAEHLTESGWSWRHVRLSRRAGRRLHVAEARNLDKEIHAVVAESITPAFEALERSIKAAEQ